MALRVGSFLPFQTTYYLNRHSFIEQELKRQRIGFRKNDNAFLAVDNVRALQAAADRLSPALIRQRLDYWTLIVGPKFSPRERKLGHLSRFYAVAQIEYCRNLCRLFYASKMEQCLIQNQQLYATLPRRGYCSAQLFAEEVVCGGLSQPKEVETYYRPRTQQSGLKLRIGELGCHIQRFLQRLVGRLIACCGSVGVPEGSEKTRPVSANICLKVGEPATSYLDCFLAATSPGKGIGQVGKSFSRSLRLV